MLDMGAKIGEKLEVGSGRLEVFTRYSEASQRLVWGCAPDTASSIHQPKLKNEANKPRG